MATTRFTTEEITYFDQQAHMFVENATTWRDWCPYKTIPMKRHTSWKVATAIADAAATLDGSRTSLAATSYATGEAQLIWFGHHFIWPELEVETARQEGVPIATEEIRLSFERINKQIARLILGGNMTWEAPTIAGLNATSQDATAAVPDWEDAGGPYAQIIQGYGLLNIAGYKPPYKLLVGDNLRPGLAAEHAAGYAASSRSVIQEAFEVESIHFEAQCPFGTTITDHDLVCYPLAVPAADDGRWYLMKSDPNNFSILEAFAPKLTIVPEMDIRTRSYYGRVDWMGTMKIVHGDAVTDENSVNLQT